MPVAEGNHHGLSCRASSPRRHDRAERHHDRGGIVLATHFADEPAARLQCSMDTSRLGRPHPMQCGIRERHIDFAARSGLARHQPGRRAQRPRCRRGVRPRRHWHPRRQSFSSAPRRRSRDRGIRPAQAPADRGFEGGNKMGGLGIALRRTNAAANFVPMLRPPRCRRHPFCCCFCSKSAARAPSSSLVSAAAGGEFPRRARHQASASASEAWAKSMPGSSR